MKDKTVQLDEAVKNYVTEGCSISFGGFTINRNPMAAVHEIIRQEIEDLHVYMHSGGQGFDLLVGAGLVESAEIAYGANGRYASTCVNFREAVESGTIRVEDYSNFQMVLRFLGGAMGVPFLPTKSGLGTDIMKKCGFSEEFREKSDRVPREKMIEMVDPFDPEGGEKVALVPSINPDVTIVHAQKAYPEGTVRVDGLTFADEEQIKSARNVIVTCEELVGAGELRRKPDRNLVSSLNVDVVVHVPFGAHPTACLNYYDYDPEHLKQYCGLAREEGEFEGYLQEYILGVEVFEEYLQKVGVKTLLGLLAGSDTGYSPGLER